MIEDSLNNYSQELRTTGLHRQRRLVCSSKFSLNFSSNDYLSLTHEKHIKKAFQIGFEKYPCGSGGSMVVCGYHPIHKSLEHAFSQALTIDDALLFSSGYAANLGVISLLARLDAHLYIDKSIHASFYDGIQLNNARYTRFLHNNLRDLQTRLLTTTSDSIVLTEGIFSMSGQLAPLSEISDLCNKSQSNLIVDEAHAFGVLGPQGLGAVVHYRLDQQQVPLRIIPFGKAFGAQGAIVVGESRWIDALLQSARSHTYSTAISPAITYGLLETLTVIMDADERRKKLFELVDYFHKAIKLSPLKWSPSQTPIQQLQLGCPRKALYYAAQLQQQGIFCQPMREPTVTKKDTGLRVILNYHHEPKDIETLFLTLEQIYESEH
ncbi:aminotransferase class I/II-fold pyridoxal phosphate-dependent enzyme [Legionella hackeliae]|uniref:8-amino-7-oxononanoate synthase n=1 Tax=Legionella hackeliae TaxID=449 RepID=A0A0A8UUG3_LEGHA|nr:aminotransferase class I/II-fold pyridoxal phosphate-dependent enzyme [Legionella hackeliae]KTD11450.1 8-amino-7-oxononanoate synthase [Legionella hackeliae]CEK10717.1 8-amino-7-oxononanoate synthase [Legionella hackeliae]STX47466.1 8-amino-7-oxononanoate synthase [Legionella hackeliae]